MSPTDAEVQAAAAVRRAEKHDLSSATITGEFHGKCDDCGATFDFDYGGDQHMDTCPECGSHEWHREDDQ